jgi:hypothetical protein
MKKEHAVSYYRLDNPQFNNLKLAQLKSGKDSTVSLQAHFSPSVGKKKLSSPQNNEGQKYFCLSWINCAPSIHHRYVRKH